MNFFRNPEIRSSLLYWLLLSALLVTLAFFLRRDWGWLTLGLCTAFTLAHLFSTWRRYQHIADLSLEIDQILHDSSRFDLARFAEGELAILHSEIYKMTVRLRQQADALQRDKSYLADSLADISHQMRTPLTAMHLIASMLRQEDVSDARRIQLCQELSQLLSRMDWLIGSLLKMSRLDAGTVHFAQEQVRVRDLVQRAAAPLAITMELRGQQLDVQLGEEDAFIGDLDWSSEAVQNVLKNCMEHTPAQGCISLRSHSTPIYTELCISDTGSGIDEADLPHLFERFYRGRNAAASSVGIGLALARMIISQQNGSIKAGNLPQGGAQFVIRFYHGTV